MQFLWSAWPQRHVHELDLWYGVLCDSRYNVPNQVLLHTWNTMIRRIDMACPMLVNKIHIVIQAQVCISDSWVPITCPVGGQHAVHCKQELGHVQSQFLQLT